MLNNLLFNLDKVLYNDGFTQPQLRVLLRAQVVTMIGAGVLALALCWLSTWPLIFAVGAAMAVLNFYWMAKYAKQVAGLTFHKGLIVSLVFRFYARLAFTGILLFLFIFWLKVPVAPLVLGLSTVMATIVLWGAAQVIEHKAKEA
ncbi:MAG: ATP synthase subunit I [Desulfovibrio sp.]|nr:MAG: ATP synthase subunit I [Desulfovibrio sp.]